MLLKGRLVLKHARPRVLAGGMPLLADVADADFYDMMLGAVGQKLTQGLLKALL